VQLSGESTFLKFYGCCWAKAKVSSKRKRGKDAAAACDANKAGTLLEHVRLKITLLPHSLIP
jgi:hypothetical protein